MSNIASAPRHQNFINGKFVASTEFFEVRNPATHALISHVPASSAAEVQQAIEVAKAAQPAWGRLPAIERAQHLRNVASLVRKDVTRLARVISEEQGKTLGLAEVEVNFTADYLDYMAEWARRLEGEIITSDRQNETIMMFRKPLGVVAGILPWNFPFFLIARKMGPALLTGNTIVIKPSEETPNNCYEFARIVEAADLPAGVFNVVNGAGQVGALLSGDAGIDLVELHRQRGHRQRHHVRRGQEHHQGQPRARRQGSRHRAGRRGPGPRSSGSARLAHHQLGTGLQLRRTRVRATPDC